jgi:hypothetical protein
MDLGKILGGEGTPGLSDVIDLLTKHKDDLAATAQIARELPRLLALFSSGLADAGGHAARAGSALTGASGATGRLGNSAATVAEISGSLGTIGELINGAAAEIAKVPLMGAPAANLAAAAGSVATSLSGLDSLADDLKDLSKLLDIVGGALEQLGTSLGGTAAQARNFLGGASA